MGASLLALVESIYYSILENNNTVVIFSRIKGASWYGLKYNIRNHGMFSGIIKPKNDLL